MPYELRTLHTFSNPRHKPNSILPPRLLPKLPNRPRLPSQHLGRQLPLECSTCSAIPPATKTRKRTSFPRNWSRSSETNYRLYSWGAIPSIKTNSCAARSQPFSIISLNLHTSNKSRRIAKSRSSSSYSTLKQLPNSRNVLLVTNGAVSSTNMSHYSFG